MSEFGIDLIRKLKPCHFKYKDGVSEDGRIHFGLIAQDINDVIQYENFAIVSEKDGHFVVNYWQIVPLLIKAIQELEEKVKELENEIHSNKG